MSFSSDREIAELTDRFICKTLPKAGWTHAAHFAVALHLLRTRGAATYTDLPPLIRAYNEATGVANTDAEGYHETITIASIRAAQAHLQDAADGTPLHRVLSDLMASKFGRSTWMLTYWSEALLFSREARKQWRDPDLAPLDF